MGYSPNPKYIQNEILKDNTNNVNNNKGWCYEGFHCNNINCKFKHRNLLSTDTENRDRCLPSSIRGPRQHSKMSSAKNSYCNEA